MIKAIVYNLEGKEIDEIKLDPAVFGLEIKPAVIHQVVEAQRANKRLVLAATKDRSEVRGGGKKPWRQKGTGRARHGSIRSPLWVGGGITFGPRTDVNYSHKINKRMKRKALFMCLTDKVNDKNFIVVDKLILEKIKTQELVKIFKNLVKDNKQILLVMAEKNENINKSARNLPKVKTVLADSLNVIDILKFKYLIIDKQGVKKIITTYKK